MRHKQREFLRRWYIMQMAGKRRKIDELDEDYRALLEYLQGKDINLLSDDAIKRIIEDLKRQAFWRDSQWLIPSTGGFKTATSNNRNVVETAYSIIPTGGDPAFLSQEFVTPGEPGSPNYNDCPELTKAVVCDKLMDVVAVEREGMKLVNKDLVYFYDFSGIPPLTTERHTTGSPTGGKYVDYSMRGNAYADLPKTLGKWVSLSYQIKIKEPFVTSTGYYSLFRIRRYKDVSYQNNDHILINNDGISLVTGSGAPTYSKLTPIGNGWYNVDVFWDNSDGDFWDESTEANSYFLLSQQDKGTETGVISIANLSAETGSYATLPIETTRLAPSPVISNFIPSTGSIAMIADIVIDEFETETFGEPGNEVEGIIKPGTTLFSSNNSNMTVRITKDYLIVGGEDELLLNDIHYHGLELEEFQRYQFGTILSFKGDMYTLFLLYLEDDSWKVRAFYGVRDITSDTHRDLFIGCDSAGNQTSVRVLNMYSTEERLTNLLEASKLFSVLTIGNLEVKKDEIERPNILYISGDSSGTSSIRRIRFSEGTQVRIFSTNNLTISGLMSDDSTITGNDGEWSDWFSVDSTANKDFTTNGSGYIEIKGNVTYLYLRALPNVTLAGDISNMDKLTTIYLSTLPNVTLAGDISNMDKLTYLYLRDLPNVTLAGDISGKKFTLFSIIGISNPMTFNGYFNSNSIQTLLDYELANPGKALFNFPLNLTFVSLTINGSYVFKIAYGNFDESSAKGLIHAGWDLAVNNKLWGNVDPPRIRTFDISGCDPEDPPGLEDQISDGVTVQDALTAIYNYGATIIVPAGWTEIKTFLSGLGV